MFYQEYHDSIDNDLFLLDDSEFHKLRSRASINSISLKKPNDIPGVKRKHSSYLYKLEDYFQNFHEFLNFMYQISSSNLKIKLVDGSIERQLSKDGSSLYYKFQIDIYFNPNFSFSSAITNVIRYVLRNEILIEIKSYNYVSENEKVKDVVKVLDSKSIDLENFKDISRLLSFIKTNVYISTIHARIYIVSNPFELHLINLEWIKKEDASNREFRKVINQAPIFQNYASLKMYTDSIDFGVIGTKLHACVKFQSISSHLINRKGLAFIIGSNFIASLVNDEYFEVIHLRIGDISCSEKIFIKSCSYLVNVVKNTVEEASNYWTSDKLLDYQRGIMEMNNSNLVDTLKLAIISDSSMNTTFCIECHLDLAEFIQIARLPLELVEVVDKDNKVSLSPRTQKFSFKDIACCSSNYPIPKGCIIVYGPSGTGKTRFINHIKSWSISNGIMTSSFLYNEPGLNWTSFASLFTCLNAFINSDQSILCIDSFRHIAFTSGGSFLSGGLNTGLLEILHFVDVLSHSFSKTIFIVLNPLSSNDYNKDSYFKIFEGSTSGFVELLSNNVESIQISIKSRFSSGRKVETFSINLGGVDTKRF